MTSAMRQLRQPVATCPMTWSTGTCLTSRPGVKRSTVAKATSQCRSPMGSGSRWSSSASRRLSIEKTANLNKAYLPELGFNMASARRDDHFSRWISYIYIYKSQLTIDMSLRLFQRSNP